MDKWNLRSVLIFFHKKVRVSVIFVTRKENFTFSGITHFVGAGGVVQRKFPLLVLLGFPL
jgi:hypothetical protein